MKHSYQNAWRNLVQRITADHLVKIKEWEQRMIELEPGLKLDKLIARQVLGWREWSQMARKTEYDRSAWRDKDGSGPVHLNHFSTDIKAAWDLVEKFKLCVTPWGGQWTATKHGQIYIDGERNLAPTAPHAICLAALFYTSGRNE